MADDQSTAQDTSGPATMPPDQVKSLGEQAPMGRAGQAVEVAPALVYFASKESSYVSGEVIGVTGGTPLH